MSAEAYRRYGPALLRKARRMLQNEADAADLVQGLFVALWERGHTDYDLPFLYRALTNRCLNLLRDEKNRARLLEQQRPALRGQARVMPDDHVLTLQVLLQVSQRVPEEVFETLVYRYFDDMGQEEIAKLTAVSRKTVQNRLNRADAALRALQTEEAS